MGNLGPNGGKTLRASAQFQILTRLQPLPLGEGRQAQETLRTSLGSGVGEAKLHNAEKRRGQF